VAHTAESVVGPPLTGALTACSFLCGSAPAAMKKPATLKGAAGRFLPERPGYSVATTPSCSTMGTLLLLGMIVSKSVCTLSHC
jgi:hypothetical protein